MLNPPSPPTMRISSILVVDICCELGWIAFEQVICCFYLEKKGRIKISIRYKRYFPLKGTHNTFQTEFHDQINFEHDFTWQRLEWPCSYYILFWADGIFSPFYMIVTHLKKSFKINRYIQDDTRDTRLLCNFPNRYIASCEL